MSEFFSRSDKAAQTELLGVDHFVSHRALLDRWKSFSRTTAGTGSDADTPAHAFGWRKGVMLADEQYLV